MKNFDFELLCQAALEGTCTEEEFRLLERELASSADRRRLFRETFLMHEVLAVEGDGLAPAAECGRSIWRRRPRVAFAAIAAGIAALAAFGIHRASHPGAAPTLRLTAGPSSAYVVAGNGSGGERDLEPGASVVLSQGTLKLQFSNGVQSIVQAPARFELQSAGKLKMDIGTARFEVPEKASGFTVITPRLEVIDLGTTFGVVAQPDEPAQTHVFQGQVKARTRTEEVLTLLNAGAAVEETDDGRLVEVPLNDSLFFKALPWDLPFVHLAFEPDRSGAVFLEGCHPSLESSVVTLHPDGAGLTEGVVGKAALFDGGNTPVVTNWKGVGGAVPRTLCAWIRHEPGLPPRRYQTVVSWGDPTIGLAAKCELLLYQPRSGDRTVMRLSFDQYLFTGTTDLADGRWHHLAAVCRTDPMGKYAPEVELYVDGRREAILPEESATNPQIRQRPDTRIGQKGSMPLVIGYTDRPAPSRGFRGAIDEVYVFEGALPLSRILLLATPPEVRQ